MYDMEFNGVTAGSLGVKIAYRPDMPTPEKRIEEIEIPGRDGNLIETDGTYNDITIDVEMNFVIPRELWGERFRQVKRWLSETGNLRFQDDQDFFYKVKNVVMDTTERTVREAGEFTASFLCDPYTYLTHGQTGATAEDVTYNGYSLAKPVYIIEGEGMCTLTVNGNKMTANVGQNLTIDTDLMIAYRTDGTPQNTEVTGEYEDLWLPPGENSVSVTDGFSLTVIPNWRCL